MARCLDDPPVACYAGAIDFVQGASASAGSGVITVSSSATFGGSGRNELLDACRELAALDDEHYATRLEKAAERLATLNVGFADPETLRLYAGSRRRVVNTAVEHELADDPLERRRLFVQQALERDHTLFEHRSQDIDTEPPLAMVRPMAQLGLYLADMEDWAFGRGRHGRWLEANAAFRQRVLDQLRESGPLQSRDIADTSAVPW